MTFYSSIFNRYILWHLRQMFMSIACCFKQKTIKTLIIVSTVDPYLSPTLLGILQSVMACKID